MLFGRTNYDTLVILIAITVITKELIVTKMNITILKTLGCSDSIMDNNDFKSLNIK